VDIDRVPRVSDAIPESADSRAFRSAGGDESALLERYGYRRDEYFVSGDSSLGAYRTRILVARPRDPAKFSGVMVAEIFQTSVWLQVRDYLMRSGHGWILISSRGNRWAGMLKNASPRRYADVQIPADETNPQILFQVVSLLKRPDAGGPTADLAVRKVLLAGYSGDGAGVRQFIEGDHWKARSTDGQPFFHAYLVAGTAVGSAPRPIPDIDAPVVEIMNENEMIRSFERGSGWLAYRRDDGPAYRLYEIPGAGHITTRGESARASVHARACKESPQSDLAMNHVYGAVLDRLVTWIDTGVAPPGAARIEYEADGRTIARDRHGNTRGGLRSIQLDVPTARYVAVSTRNPEYRGELARCDMIAHRVPFPRETLETLYGTPEGFVRSVELRADELVKQGWYLAEDAEEIKREAAAFRWP
jgi:hypothetical protein